ncbi:MAG: FliM/FliN family flagellar motor switch protein [Gammaproteobacteria bacterium]|nr:FliM/FliN family flagellar motor switch protein [Gammaproteobacteria bacterium]
MANPVSAFDFKELTVLHRLGLSAAEYHLAGAGDNWKIRWRPASEIIGPQGGAQTQWICLSLLPATGYTIKLYLQQGLFEALLQGIEPARFWELDPLLRCACFQVYNQGTLNWVEQHWRIPVRVTAIDLLDGEPDYRNTAAFALSESPGADYQPGLVEVAGAGQGQPLSALFKRTSHRTITAGAAIPLPLDIVIGQTRAPLPELRQLQRNDLILLEAGEFSPATASLCLQGKALFLAGVEQRLLRVKQLLRTDFMTDTDTPPAGQTGVDANAGATDGQDKRNAPEADSSETQQARIDPNGIEVVLHFSLGTLTRTLAEMENIGAGYVFELPRQTSECVDINVNGKRLAQGEPVRIEDRLAIRVVSIECA